MGKVHYLFIWVLALATFGCAGIVKDPYGKDLLTTPDFVKFSEDDERQVKVNYIARYLMDRNNRGRIESEIRNEEFVRRFDSSDAGVATAIAADIATGQLSSAAGKQLGGSVFVATSVLGAVFNGSNKNVSGAYLPQEMNGKTLETPDDAIAALNELIEKQMLAASVALDWESSCFKGCGSDNQFWRFETEDRGPENGQYIYTPAKIAVQITYDEIIKVPPGDVVSGVLEEPIAWQTQFINGFNVIVFESEAYDEAGLPALVYSEKAGKEFIGRGNDLSKVGIGRDFLRAFHSTPYTFFGSKSAPGRVFYNGDAYRFRVKVDRIYPPKR